MQYSKIYDCGQINNHHFPEAGRNIFFYNSVTKTIEENIFYGCQLFYGGRYGIYAVIQFAYELKHFINMDFPLSIWDYDEEKVKQKVINILNNN